MKQHEFGIFKYNNGRLAILCNECSVIIKIGKEFNEEEKEAVIGRKTIPPQYCENCKEIRDGKVNRS